MACFNLLRCRSLVRVRSLLLVSLLATVMLLLLANPWEADVRVLQPTGYSDSDVDTLAPDTAGECCSNATARVSSGSYQVGKLINSDAVQNDITIKSFLNSAASLCDGKFTGHANQFAIMRNVTLSKSFAKGKRHGGEEMKEVMNQPEEHEYFEISRGFLSMACSSNPVSKYSFQPADNPGNTLVRSVADSSNGPSASTSAVFYDQRPTLLVQRHEYVNMYHTMTDWYNTFIMMVVFRLDPSQVQVVFLDAHPKGVLDSTWNVLFNRFVRLKQLPDRVQFSQLIYTLWGYKSPISTFNGDRLPLAEPFRTFVLTQHGFTYDINRKLNCSNLVATIIFRKPYVSHPRNPTGSKIERRFANDDELAAYLQKEFVKTHKLAEVQAVSLERLSVTEQIRLVSRSDILIGMHGAGLTLSLFLPLHGGVIELLPSYLGTAPHFNCIAKWRNLAYVTWQNQDSSNEKGPGETRIPPSELGRVIDKLINNMKCGASN